MATTTSNKCLIAMAIPFLLVLFTVFVDLTRAQLNLPEMPGPPYPDRWGNNRWGVKYDPRVHGRGSRPPSHHQSSSASGSGPWGESGSGGTQPENRPPRYRGGGDWSPPYSQNHQHQSSRGKWAPGLKPLVSTLSKFKLSSRNRRPSPSHNGGGGRDTSAYAEFDPTSDSFYNDAYTSKSIDGYVKNYMDHYSSVSQTPSASSDLVNIKNFAGRLDLSDKFRPRNFARPSRVSSSDHGSSTSFVHTSRISKREPSSSSTFGSNSKPNYRTYNPQTDFFGPGKSTNRNFAKTLSNIYNEYKPGAENTVSGLRSGDGSSSSSSSMSNNNAAAAASDSISNSVIVTDEELDDYASPPSFSSSRPPHSKPSSSRPPRPRPSAVRTSGKGGSGPPPPSYYSKRPRGGRGRPRPPGKGRPLSALDMYEEARGEYSFSGPDYSSEPLYSSGDNGPSYSVGGGSGPSYSSGSGGGPSYSTSDGGLSYSSSFSSGGPGGGYSMSSGPTYSGHRQPYSSSFSPGGPPSSLYSFDSFGLGPGPMSSGPDFPPPSHHHGLNYIPPSNNYYSPPSYPPNKRKPKRKNKNRSQHTPMNILRGLLGRGDRDSKRAYANLPEHSPPQPPPHHPYSHLPAPVLPPVIPHPPQYDYNPLLNSLSGGLDFMDGPREPFYPRPHHPPPAGPFSLLGGLAGLTGLRDRPHQRPHPFQGISGPHHQAPPGSRLPRPSSADDEEGEQNHNGEQIIDQREKKEYKTAYNNWPRIFTAVGSAVGSTVDAVAAGIHAARKEVSKMTGEAVAKGIMMGGTAVHEVSKGMATVITKMSAI